MIKTRKRMESEKVVPEEISEYRTMAGTLMYLENSVLTQAALITYLLQQKLAYLRVGHLVSDIRILIETIGLDPKIKNNHPWKGYKPTLFTLSDASHGSGDS